MRSSQAGGAAKFWSPQRLSESETEEWGGGGSSTSGNSVASQAPKCRV